MAQAPAPIGSATCRYYGAEDTFKFGAPMPWIGVYVALASLVLAALLSADIVDSLRMKRRWISAKWLPFNSATLALLGIATKVPADISTAMPGLGDQLAKLSGVVLMCVIIAHATSTHATDGAATVFSNMTALGIMVVTLVVDVWIQIHTGVVVEFVVWYKVGSALMLFLFVAAVQQSVYDLMTKDAAGYMYNLGANDLMSDELDTDSLRQNIPTYWKNALTYGSPGNPFLGRDALPFSAIVSAGMAITFMVTVATQTFQGYATTSTWRHCYTRSDYSWSNIVVLFSQFIAILVGTVSCLLRTIATLSATSVFDSNIAVILSLCRNFGIIIITDWVKLTGTHCFPFFPQNEWAAMGAQAIRNTAGMLYFIADTVITWPVIFTRLFFSRLKCRGLFLMSAEVDSKNLSAKWIDIGSRSKPLALLPFLKQNSTPSQGFPLVKEAVHIYWTAAASGPVPSSCWSLAIATLATIAYATTTIEELQDLMNTVQEALAFAFLVDGSFSYESKRLILAAKLVWAELNLNGRWLDVSLRKPEITGNNTNHITRHLQERAKKRLLQHKALNNLDEDDGIESTYEFFLTTSAAKCMHATTSRILQTAESASTCSTTDTNVIQPEKILSDVIGACMLSLTHAIRRNCTKGKLHAMDEKARDAAFILGQAEETVQWLKSECRPEHWPSSGKEYMKNWQGLSA